MPVVAACHKPEWAALVVKGTTANNVMLGFDPWYCRGARFYVTPVIIPIVTKNEYAAFSKNAKWVTVSSSYIVFTR